MNSTVPPSTPRRPVAPLGPGEELVAWARAWVSTPGRLPRILAARTRDLVVVTHDRLSMFSIGFFSRRARRRVYDVPLAQVAIAEVPARRGRRLQITSAAHPPMVLDLGAKPAAGALVDTLLQLDPRSDTT